MTNKIKIAVGLLFLLGFALRILLINLGHGISTDFLIFEEWGNKYWELGPKEFYFYKYWDFARPNYPPMSSFIFAVAYWLFDHKYVLAQLHNLIKIPPAAFIVFFYDYGYNLLLKIPAFFSDLGLAYIVYKLILKFSGNIKKAYLGSFLFFLNPVTIFLSSVWGQIDSLVALIGIMAFILLIKKKFVISAVLFFAGLYIKPNWVYLLPFFGFVFFSMKPKIKHLLLASFFVFLVYVMSTLPFAKNGLFDFTAFVFKERLLPSAIGASMASSSAFNFYTIFLEINKSSLASPIAGIPANVIAWLAYIVINITVFVAFLKSKNKLFALISGIFIISFGVYLFMTNMLERYFFAGFAPFIVLLLTKPKLLVMGAVLNLNVFLNIFWSFYRRKYNEINHPFINNDYLLLRLISVTSIFSWLAISRKSLKGIIFKG
ncbi:hypothetical protein A3E46_02755 [Candidatus Woesebacteria bacterium RIFCSPHIGHO2_12_FULL_46_16]|uniref:Glycosyltransferase RgtA/B/C/D-like domain-containing protein n=1 Tax=Candidatus Woesebacteria bacterium RIFCSPHIGHO2_12_FULL_46_16 TaxID=1802513 RepID=A0A1F8AYJ7_9BACT|nr:MAG: hypothetical protein A3E46_02755 [Candidatus Woesebacteria bacterium RIFCSPHIGHO2_12_FULL_46_16]